MKKRFTLMTAVFALLAILALPMGMKGQTKETHEVTYGYADLKEMLTGSYLDANSYWKVPETAGNNASISIPITYQPESNITMTLRIATFGSGNNPSSSNTTISAIGTESNSNWSGSGVNAYPSSSTYVNAIMTIAKPENPTTLGGLNITIGVSTGVKIFRLQSVAIKYTYGGGTPITYTVTYDCNGGTSGCPENATGIESGTQITLANAPSKDGFDFAGWSNGSATLNAGSSYTVTDDVTFTAQWNEQPSADEQWVLTSLADLTENDVFVIVGNNGSTFAMSNDKGTASAPTAVAVTVANNLITSAVTSNIKWTISGNATDGYTFYPNGTTETWLYCFNNNNGVRVGTGDDKTFVISSDYIYNSGQSRYIGIYNSADWRSYTSINNNIKDQTFAFYKKVTGEVLPPSITAENVSIEYDATSGTIEYTINNPVDGGSLTANTESDWITLGTIGEAVPFTCTANTEGTQRTASITLTYTFNRETVTKEVTVTQGAAPVTYTTIPALFDAATSTETNIFVTFNNWVVSGVSTNGKNVFVTDNNGNGFVIYGNEDMSNTYATGNVLSGTAVSCTLKKSNGYAQLLNVNATDLTITDGGTVSVANIALADLAGVNTGALVHYENMTCNINNNRYYLTDGTTTIQLYNSLYAFGALENGETYNITGIYQQYNNTKEILPRSADDIEEVEVPTEEYTLTVSDPENITFTVVYGEEVLANGEAAEIANGTEITMTVNVSEGYVLESLTVVGENEQVVSITENNGVYSFYMPAYNATVNATAMEYIAPSGSNFVRISSLDQLTDGSVVVIASRYNETANNYFAMKNAIGSKIQGTVFESVTSGTNEVLSSTISDDINNYYWVVGVTSEGYTFTNASGDKIGYGSSTNFATNGEKTLWTVTSGTSGAALVQEYQGFTITNVNINDRGIALRDNNGTKQFGAYSTGNNNGDSYNFFLDFFVQTETVEPESYTLTINGYAAGSDDGYYLIASPVNVNPAEVQGMTEGEFDLYYFDESQDLEWINYKGENGSFNLEPGKGYLYAKKATTEGEVFSFELSGTPYDGTPITLAKVGNGEFQGWNLVGNPFADTAYINRDFYVMKEDGSEIITGEGNKIAPMQGFFVIAEQDGEELAISTEAPSNTGSKIVVNVTQNRGNVIDRAIVRFGEGRQLPKFMMNPGNTKLFIAQADNEYAVVRSANEGEMPVSFKAAENGYYTLNIKAEDTEMGYLHLIDNMTGADVDLLSTPNYTFQANTTDYANRFCLVYAATTSINESASDEFAFFNGNEWVINSDGEATLQVIDMTGRVLSSQTVNGNTNLKLNQANGVYLLRLLQNNTVKNQKIVKE